MQYSFRDALPSDSIECVRILRDYFDEKDWLPDSHDLDERTSMERWWRDHFQCEMAWVAENDGVIIGFCSRQRSNNNISALYVVPESRNEGVGKQLLDKAKENCEQIIVWAFEQNHEARKFYYREGLVEVAREIDEDLNIVDIEHHWTRT